MSTVNCVSTVIKTRLGTDQNVRSGTIHALAELLCTVVLVKEIVSDLLEIGQVAVKKGATNSKEIRVTRVLDLDNTPWVLTGADLAVLDLDKVLGANNGERHQTTEFGVLLDSILIILLDIVGEVVNRNAVVLNILHDQLLRLGQFGGCEGVGLADDGDDVNTGGEALHQFDVELAKAVASGGDEVKEDVDTVVSEAGVTLNSGLLSKDVIVLALEVADNLAEAIKTS